MANYPKLQTNIPIIGRAKYADVVEGNYGPQLALKGEWEGYEGASKLFLPESAVAKLVGLGILAEQPNDKGQHKVLSNARIQILRTEDGTKKQTVITLADGPGSVSPAPQRPQSASAPRQAAPGANGAARPAAAAPAVNNKEKVERLQLTMKKCLEASAKIWKEIEGSGILPSEYMPDIAATAHTLFIAFQKEGILAQMPAGPQQAKPAAPPPMITEQQKQQIAEFAATAGLDDNDLDGMLRTLGVQSVDSLTQAQALNLVGVLHVKAKEAEALLAAGEQGVGEDIPF